MLNQSYTGLMTAFDVLSLTFCALSMLCAYLYSSVGVYLILGGQGSFVIRILEAEV